MMNLAGLRGKTECTIMPVPSSQHSSDNLRKTGQTAGKADIYYYSPSNLAPKADPMKTILPSLSIEGSGIIGSNSSSSSIDLTTSFPDHHHQAAAATKLLHNINPNISLHQTTSLKRKAPPSELSPSAAAANTQKQQFDYSSRSMKDASLVPPIRQTASIFKQPVTVHRNMSEGKSKNDLKPASNDKPKQVFWEKRLEGLRACAADGEEFASVDFGKLKPVAPISDMTLQSVATALHLNSGTITGQQASKATILSNPVAFITPDQPMIYSITITDEDIRKQEERVNLARKKLQDALRA